MEVQVQVQVQELRSTPRPRGVLQSALVVLALAIPAVAEAQRLALTTADSAADSARSGRSEVAAAGRRTSAKRRTGEASTSVRVIVSLDDRSLVVVDADGDTLRNALVGVGMDSTLAYQGRVWDFRTPRGRRRVIRKVADPTWAPPDWHYVEIAHARGLKLVKVPADRSLYLEDGSEMVVRDGDVGLVRPGVGFMPFAIGEEVIWEGTLYIPPLGTRQRVVAGELGRYRLDLGDGYLLHGTPHPESIGQPSSHGCIRVGDDDIEWLYTHVPLGTPVEIR
jgi:hypothetical protein